MNTPELAQAVENTIKIMLLAALARSDNYLESEVPRLVVYDRVMKLHSKDGIITTGFFNRIVGDMKKTSIIGTARGGEVLFITKMYWKLTEGMMREEEYLEEHDNVVVDSLVDDVLTHLHQRGFIDYTEIHRSLEQTGAEGGK